jgi:hypothetical protein
MHRFVKIFLFAVFTGIFTFPQLATASDECAPQSADSFRF